MKEHEKMIDRIFFSTERFLYSIYVQLSIYWCVSESRKWRLIDRLAIVHRIFQIIRKRNKSNKYDYYILHEYVKLLSFLYFVAKFTMWCFISKNLKNIDVS